VKTGDTLGSADGLLPSGGSASAVGEGRCITSLSGGENEREWPAAGICSEVDLCGQSATGPTDGVVVRFAGRGPFRRSDGLETDDGTGRSPAAASLQADLANALERNTRLAARVRRPELPSSSPDRRASPLGRCSPLKDSARTPVQPRRGTVEEGRSGR
jgi:hypothetical protein